MGSEQAKVLDLVFVKSERHSTEDLSDAVETNSDVLVVAVLCYKVLHDPLQDWLNRLGRNQVMATFDDHGEDFANFVFVVRVQIPEEVWIEL